jgi:phenylacetate-CoA ligase
MNYKKTTIPLLSDLINKTNIRESFSLIQKLNSYSFDELRSWQSKQFLQLVNHFYENSKYYRNKLIKHGVSINDIKGLNDINKLPIITKEEFVNNRDDIIPCNIDSIKHRQSATGGSTGNPMRFLLDLRSLSYNTAYNILSWERNGDNYKYGDKHIFFGSSSLLQNRNIPTKKRVYDLLRGRILYGGIDLSDTRIPSLLKVIKSKKVKHLYGYASMIFIIADYLRKQNISPPTNIRTCFTTSEVLTDHYRETIEKYMDCKVVDCYGARDGGITSYEASYKKYEVGYNCFVEVDSKTNTGAILCTDLLNFAFPFIRYKLGDVVTLECEESNYNGQLLSNIYGRKDTIMRFGNGKIINCASGLAMMFMNYDISSYKIIQIDLNKVLVSMIPLEFFSINQLELIKRELQNVFGFDCEVIIEIVNSFELLKSGKRNFIINKT